MKVAGMQMRRIWCNPIPAGASSPNNATVAAEIGDAVMACCDAIVAIESGRSGRTPALRETSAITGSNA